MTYILGLNAYHGDSSACLIRDGRLVAAAEEERFRRIKHWAGFPSEAIRYCLDEASIPLSKVDHLAVNSAPSSNLLRKIGFTLRNRPDFSFVMERLKNAGARAGLGDELTQAFPGDHFGGVIHRVEHHLAHLASTFLVSPFDEAAAVSVDGFGDFASAAWGLGRGTRVEVSDRVFFPHSLGIFYMAMTQYLGFPHWGDEYKVMGLAPYGQPTCVKELEQVVRLVDGGKYELEMRFFRHQKEKLQEWPGSAPHVARIFTEALEALLGPARDPSSELTQRHRDIARSTQVVYENAFFHLLQAVHRQYPVDAIALAGGCAMNSVANGKIYDRSPFKRAYVQAAAGDAGGAIGAALSVWQGLNGSARPESMNHAYWGPDSDSAEIEACLASHQSDILAQGCRLEHVDEATLLRRVAQAIADGQVVGWFQGRMEWGPRALGNRSILADPRRADMKDILNLKIKRRESFRPFAPSILREAVHSWFETDDDVPFMTQVFQIRSECRARIPAVTHVDGSGRLQTVSRDANPRYYALIDQFNALTGVPIVLNTSFNENEPIVCVPEQALDCFLRTRMDMLALGDRLLTRDGSAASQ